MLMMEAGVKLSSGTMLKRNEGKFLLNDIYKSQICYTIITSVWTLGEVVQYNMMHKFYVILAPKMTGKAIMLIAINILMSYM